MRCVVISGAVQSTKIETGVDATKDTISHVGDPKLF